MQTETLPQFQFPRIAPRSLINFCARIGRIPLRPVLSSRNTQQDVAWIIHERKSFGVSSRVEGPLYSKDSSPVSFFYRGPSTPRPPDPQKKPVGSSLRALRSEAVTKFGFQSAAGKLGFVAGGG